MPHEAAIAAALLDPERAAPAAITPAHHSRFSVYRNNVARKSDRSARGALPCGRRKASARNPSPSWRESLSPAIRRLRRSSPSTARISPISSMRFRRMSPTSAISRGSKQAAPAPIIPPTLRRLARRRSRASSPRRSQSFASPPSRRGDHHLAASDRDDLGHEHRRHAARADYGLARRGCACGAARARCRSPAATARRRRVSSRGSRSPNVSRRPPWRHSRRRLTSILPSISPAFSATASSSAFCPRSIGGIDERSFRDAASRKVVARASRRASDMPA